MYDAEEKRRQHAERVREWRAKNPGAGKETYRKWAAENRAELNAKAKEWREKQSPEWHEKQRAYQQAYRDARKEERSRYNREYRAKDPSAAKARDAAYYKANPRRFKDAAKRSRQKNPARYRYLDFRKYIAWKYSLTMEQFGQMLIAQDGRCDICNEPLNRNLHIDHNHQTGKVRGLLCNGCNTGIGHLRETEAFLLAALAYLKKHSP